MWLDGNNFLHAQPNYTTGAYKKYIKVVTSCTGILSRNYFGLDEANIDTLCSIGSMLDIANMSATDTGFCTNS